MKPSYQIIQVLDAMFLLILVNIQQEHREKLKELGRGIMGNIHTVSERGYYPKFYGTYEISGLESRILSIKVDEYLKLHLDLQVEYGGD